VRLSRILDRYDFSAVGREAVDERCALVFDLAARPDDFDLERDGLLRRLAGRLWKCGSHPEGPVIPRAVPGRRPRDI
jgi:hypothetical protein